MRYVVVHEPMPMVMPGMWSSPGKGEYAATTWRREKDGTLVVLNGTEEVASYAAGQWSSLHLMERKDPAAEKKA